MGALEPTYALCIMMIRLWRAAAHQLSYFAVPALCASKGDNSMKIEEPARRDYRRDGKGDGTRGPPGCRQSILRSW